MLERIAAISDPAVRLQALRTLVLSEMVLPGSMQGRCSGESLLERIRLVSESALALKLRLITADAARMPRLSVDDLVRALTFLVFREFAPSLSLSTLEYQLHKRLDDLSALEQQVLPRVSVVAEQDTSLDA